MTQWTQRTILSSAGTAALLLLGLGTAPVSAQSLDIPSKTWGISFGNSKTFTGLRFNFQDRGVQRVTGVNFTLWMPHKKENDAVVTGLSIGIVNYAWRIERGLQIGLVNIVRDNPKGSRVLPLFNANFR